MIETMGIDAFRAALIERFAKEAEPEGELLARRIGLREETDLGGGRVARRIAPPFGVLDRATVERVLALCERHDVDEIRLGCDQALYLPGVPAQTPPKRTVIPPTVACIGTRGCVYSLLDTKESLQTIAQKCADAGISLGFSGCLKGCARHAYADIGLVGIRTRLYADEVERGVRLYLGAVPSEPDRAGRLILYGVPLRSLASLIDLLIALYRQSGRESFEAFSRCDLNRFSDPGLAFWILLNYHGRHVEGRKELVPLPEGEGEGEMGRFIRMLKALGRQEVAARLDESEAYPYRSAIARLEREAFAAG